MKIERIQAFVRTVGKRAKPFFNIADVAADCYIRLDRSSKLGMPHDIYDLYREAISSSASFAVLHLTKRIRHLKKIIRK